MKIKLLILFTLLTIVVNAQQQRVERIEQTITKRGSAFFLRSEAVLEDSSRVAALENGRVEERIGDTATLNNFLKRTAIDQANAFAESFVNVAQKRLIIKALKERDSLLRVFTGAKLDSLIQAEYEGVFLGIPNDTIAPKWEIKDGQNITNVSFNKAGNGNLRIRIGGTNYRVFMRSSRFIEFRDYPLSGQTTYFYSPRDGVFWSEGRLNNEGLVLRLQGLRANGLER